MVISSQTQIDQNQAMYLSHLVTVCENTLNEDTSEKSARLVIGLDNLSDKIQFDRDTMNKSERVLGEDFLRELSLRKRELETRIADTAKKIRDKNLSITSKVVSIEHKLMIIFKKTNSIEMKAPENTYVNKSIETMEEYLETAEKDLEELRFLSGGQTDSYLCKETGTSYTGDNTLQHILVNTPRPALISFTEKLKNSLKILEDVILDAENDVREIEHSQRYRFV